MEPESAGHAHFPPFYSHIGIEVPDSKDLALTVTRRNELLNGAGNLHGGVLLGLLDAALSRAIRFAIPEGSRIATVDLTVHFLQGANGNAVTASGSVIRTGATLAFARGTAVDAAGDPVAVATGVYRVFLK